MPYKDPEKKRAYQRSWYKKNAEKVIKKTSARQKANPEKYKEYSKKWRDRNPEKNKEQRRAAQKRYREAHPEKVKEMYKSYVSNLEGPALENFKKLSSARSLKWYKKNSSYVINQRKKRYKTDPIFKFTRITRVRIYQGIKSVGAIKDARAENLLGCSFEEAHNYITSLFKPGMSWKNHGFHGWHIDHVKPIASFNLADPEEQRKCFHYTNLQPLWAEENLKKGNKILNDKKKRTRTKKNDTPVKVL